MLKDIIEIATVTNTKATVIDRRFEREWKNLSQNVKIYPIAAPRAIDNTTSIRGSQMMETIFALPAEIAFAMPNETEKSTRPTASSRATTGKSVDVTGPFALYCLTTISVAAGAVADATAPRTIAASKGSF